MNTSQIYEMEFDEQNTIYKALQVGMPVKGDQISLEQLRDVLLILVSSLQTLDNMDDVSEQYAGTKQQNFEKLKKVFYAWKKIYKNETMFSRDGKTPEETIITIGDK